MLSSSLFSFKFSFSFAFWASISLSSIFLNNGFALFISCPAGKGTFASSQLSSEPRFIISAILSALVGRNGFKVYANVFANWLDKYKQFAAFCGFSFTAFQGSASLKYLFPILATLNISTSASLNSYLAMFSPAMSGSSSIAFLNSSSSSVGFSYSGILLSNDFLVKTKVRCRKFPMTSASSSLFLLWKSSHEKSESLFKGAFIVR